jgi:hypothetical protein
MILGFGPFPFCPNFLEIFVMKTVYEVVYGVFAVVAWGWLGISVLALVWLTIIGSISKNPEIEKVWIFWFPQVFHGLMLVVISDVARRLTELTTDSKAIRQ